MDIDDIILAWPKIIERMGPPTSTAMREAQPVSYKDNTLTLAIPKDHFETATGRLQREIGTPFAKRSATSWASGRSSSRSRTKGFAGASAPKAATDDGSEPVGEPPPDDEPPPASHTADDDDDYVSPDEINDAPVADVAVDSVGLFAKSFDATVVEVVTRD